MQEESDIKKWLNEYENYLSFLIIASVNISMNNVEYYNYVQEQCVEIVVFGLCFLLDEYFNTRLNSVLMKHYAQCIKNVFVLCAMIMENIYKIQEKKKSRNVFRNVFKTKKTDYSKSSIYKLFNEGDI